MLHGSLLNHSLLSAGDSGVLSWKSLQSDKRKNCFIITAAPRVPVLSSCLPSSSGTGKRLLWICSQRAETGLMLLKCSLPSPFCSCVLAFSGWIQSFLKEMPDASVKYKWCCSMNNQCLWHTPYRNEHLGTALRVLCLLWLLSAVKVVLYHKSQGKEPHCQREQRRRPSFWLDCKA